MDVKYLKTGNKYLYCKDGVIEVVEFWYEILNYWMFTKVETNEILKLHKSQIECFVTKV